MSELRNNFPPCNAVSQPENQNVFCFCIYSSTNSDSSLLLHFELDASAAFDVDAAQNKRFESDNYQCSKLERESLYYVIVHNKCSLVNLESHVSFFKYSFEQSVGERLTAESLVRKIHVGYEILVKYFLFGVRQECSLAKIAASSFFRPNTAVVTTKRGWLGSQTTSISSLSPHVMLTLHEEMTFLKTSTFKNVRVTGALNLHSTALPSLSTLSLGIDLSGRPSLVPSEDVFIDVTNLSTVARLDCSLDNENLFLARYDVEHIPCPLDMKVKVRIRELDKIVEMSIWCKNQLPKNVRMQNLHLRFSLPPGTVNAILLGKSHMPDFAVAENNTVGLYNVLSLFGGGEVESILSIAVSTVENVPLIMRRLNNFVCSFYVEDFSYFRLDVSKFKIADQSHRSLPVERKTRQILSCNGARINLLP